MTVDATPAAPQGSPASGAAAGSGPAPASGTAAGTGAAGAHPSSAPAGPDPGGPADRAERAGARTTGPGTGPSATDAGPSAAADALPLEVAGRALERRLAARHARRARSGVREPTVAAIGAVDLLGDSDVTGPRPDQDTSRRAAATVHLTADAVLIGPWGAAPGAAAGCGTCLAMRWQRLRTRSERDALETGTATRAVGDWPVLPDHLVDAVWSLYELVMADGARGGTSDGARAGTDGVAGGRAGAGPGGRVGGGGDGAHTREDGTRAAGSAGGAAPDGRASEGLPRVTRLDLETLLVRTVPLLPEPRCPDCARHTPRTGAPDDRVPADGAAGSPARHAPAEGADPVLPLAPRPKPGQDTYRLRPPASYALPTDALANPVCGVLGAGTWADVTSPTTAPVAGSVFVRGYAGLNDVTWSGQGNSFAHSRDLAFLEGLERYAGTHRRRPGGLLVDSYANLGDAALDPRSCGVYGERTYRDDPMVSPFSPDRPIPWTQGYSLRDHRPVLVPSRLCYYSAGLAADNFVFECSNGCAIGSCVEEAALFGLLELIERDAFLLGWYGNAPLTEIALDSCRTPAVRAMIDRAALQGYDVHVFDNRIDLPLPVVTGLAVRTDSGPGTLAFAAAAAFDPDTAVESAVSEILTYIPHLPGQVRKRPDELAAMADDFSLVRRLPDHAALFGLERMAGHARSYLEPAAVEPLDRLHRDWLRRRPRSGDLLDDLLFCRDTLVEAGFDVIVVDQTPPEQERLGLRTVCTLVPGLLPIDFGWSRQRALHMPRLRTALRRAGLRPTDLSDQDLRRVPHPFP